MTPLAHGATFSLSQRAELPGEQADHASYRDCGLQENRASKSRSRSFSDGLIYDLEDARKAGVKLGEVRTSEGVPAILAQWHGNAELARACEELAPLARSGKLQAVAGGMAALTAPFRPERIFCAAANYIEHANEMGSVLAGKADSKPYMFIKLRNTVIGPGEPNQDAT